MHVNRGHASAQQLKRVSADPGRGNMHLITCADEVLALCEGCRAFDKAPHVPVAGTSAAATFNGKLKADLSFSADVIALHIMGASSESSPLIPVRTESPQEVPDAFCSSWVGVFGPPVSVQIGGGGGWANELWAELRSDRRIKLLFQGADAHP